MIPQHTSCYTEKDLLSFRLWRGTETAGAFLLCSAVRQCFAYCEFLQLLSPKDLTKIQFLKFTAA